MFCFLSGEGGQPLTAVPGDYRRQTRVPGDLWQEPCCSLHAANHQRSAQPYDGQHTKCLHRGNSHRLDQGRMHSASGVILAGWLAAVCVCVFALVDGKVAARACLCWCLEWHGPASVNLVLCSVSSCCIIGTKRITCVTSYGRFPTAGVLFVLCWQARIVLDTLVTMFSMYCQEPFTWVLISSNCTLCWTSTLVAW